MSYTDFKSHMSFKEKTFFKNLHLKLNSFHIRYFIYDFQQNTNVAILMLIFEMKNYGSET